MFHKDTFRLIKKTFNRFFSLVMIVLIGVAFMMGLLSTRPIMEKSVDIYADDYSLQDLQLFSSYGFGQDDLNAICTLDYIDKVNASRFADVYSLDSEGEVRVTRIEEADKTINKLELVDGRFPEKLGEAVILDSGMTKGSFRIGEKFTLFLEDSDILDTLRTDEFSIVGIVKTPGYMAKTLGTGTLKNLDLGIVVYTVPSTFKADYYSTVYLTVKGSQELNSYGAEYDQLIADAKEEFEGFAKNQQEVRKESLLAEYREEIANGEAELAKNKEEGQKKLDEAKQQLDEANIQIISGEAQLSTIESTLKTLLTRQQALTEEYENRSSYSSSRIRQIEQSDPEGRDFDAIFAEVTADYATYNALVSMKENAQGDYAEGLQTAIDDLEKKHGGQLSKKYTEYTELQQDRAYSAVLSQEVALAVQAEERAKQEIAKLRGQLAYGRKQYENGLVEYQKGLEEFNTEIEKAELEIRKAYQELDELPDANWMILDRSSHYSSYMYKNNASQMGAIGVSLPVLFYLVAALVCLTTMTRLIDEQRGQIGVFRALGFSKKQITAKYVIYALMATLIGSVFGILLGMFTFPVVIYNAWRLMYDLPEMAKYVPPLNLLICLLAFSVLMAGVTVYVVNKTLREVPSQLMRPKAPKNAKKIFLEKIRPVWRLFSFTGKITARNLVRYKARALMTIIGVAGCTGLLVVGWGIKDSIQDIVSIQFGEIYDYDYTLSIDNSKHLDAAVEALEKDLSNEMIVPYMTYSSKVYLESSEPAINVVVMDARDGSEVLKLRKTDKTTPLKIKNSGVIISEKFSINNNLKEGDYITIESGSGLKASAKISAICEMYFQHYLYISDDYYDQLFDEPVHKTQIALRNSEESAAEIEEQVKHVEGYESLVDFSAITNNFETMLEALNFIILVIILTAGSLAFVVLINLTQVNISERIREIATLKVLGFHNSEVDSYIFKEIFLLSLAGAIIGLPLGVVEHHFIMNIINMEMIMFGNNVKPLSFAYAFAVTIGFTFIVMLLTIKPLKKVEMIESLKSVE